MKKISFSNGRAFKPLLPALAGLVLAACAQDGGDRRARDLRKWVARIDGAIRYLHLCKERQPGAGVWVYWIEWHPQPQRHNAGRGAAHG